MLDLLASPGRGRVGGVVLVDEEAFASGPCAAIGAGQRAWLAPDCVFPSIPASSSRSNQATRSGPMPSCSQLAQSSTSVRGIVGIGVRSCDISRILQLSKMLSYGYIRSSARIRRP